jgi:hypothetical protein
MANTFSDIDDESIFGISKNTKPENILLDTPRDAEKNLEKKFKFYVTGPHPFIKRNLL